MSAFSFGQPTRAWAVNQPIEPCFRPRGPAPTWVLPQPRQQQEPTSTSATTKKKAATKKSDFEKRLEICRVYSAALSSQLQKKKKAISLHGVCKSSAVYQRVLPVWKELGLDNLLAAGVNTDSDAFQALMNNRFPLSGDAALNPKKRASNGKVRRSSEDWSSLLIDMYTCLSEAKQSGANSTMVSYMDDILQLPVEQRPRVYRVWKELKLSEALANSVPVSDLLARIDSKYPVQNETEEGSRDCSAHSSSIFDAEEEETFCDLVKGLAKMGFPLDKGNLQDLCNNYLAEENGTRRGQSVSMKTIERMYKHGQIDAKDNVNPIDPKRAAQAEPEVLNAFFHQLDESIKILHELDPVAYSSTNLTEIEAMPNYNTKEMKVAIAKDKPDSPVGENQRLPDDSIKKFKAAVKYCIDCGKDAVMVVAFTGFYIHDDDFISIKKYIDDANAAVICSMPDLLLLRTDQEDIVTVKLVGGSGRFFEPDKKKSSTKRRKREIHSSIDQEFGALTQECHGVFEVDLTTPKR